MGFVVKHKRSFRKRRNRVGEITEPCGTPEFTGYILELKKCQIKLGTDQIKSTDLFKYHDAGHNVTGNDAR